MFKIVKEEYTLKVFEKRMSRRISEHKGEIVVVVVVE
jgi:hypothetical protein